MSIIDMKKQVRIIDYAARLGLNPIKVGRWYSLKEHDSIRIDPVKNLFYRNSTGESGSIIDFIMTFSGKSLKEAIKELEEYSEGHESVLASCLMHEENKAIGLELNLPQKADTNKNVYAYLTKTRGIDKDVVNWMIQKEYIYQDIHKNCVFVSYRDGVPVFASLRGTNTYRRFLADITGSDYTHGLLFPGEKKEETLIITESSIDAMSLMTLGKKGDFLALSGVNKTEPVINHLSKGVYKNIVLALDNDDAGKMASEKIEKRVKDINPTVNVCISFPKAKDWNEELKKEK